MDREPEDLQFLGIVGIVEEAYNILRSFTKMLGGGQQTGRQENHDWERTKLFFFLGAYAVFVLAFSLLSTATIVYIVASIYTGKEISYKRVMSVVPRVWKRLMVTFLGFFIIVFAYCAAFVFACFLFIFTTILFQFNSAVFHLGLVVITVVFFGGYVCGYVYLSMVWHLSCVISVLEDKYGLGTMRKSKDLIKGRITALALEILYLIFNGIIGGFSGLMSFTGVAMVWEVQEEARVGLSL